MRLLRRRMLHTFGRKPPAAIFHLSPLVRHFPAGFQPATASPESEWHSPQACVEAAERASAPIVWIDGTEPLLHPGIGEVVSALARRGRHVFLHTSGSGLRKRIHEFDPVERLYLTLEVPMPAEPGVPRMDAGVHPPSFATVAEAMRTARLSGFHVCAHFTVGETTTPAGILPRVDALRLQHLDGFILSSGAACGGPGDARLSKSLNATSQLIPSSSWRSFSRLLEDSYEQWRDSAPRPQGADRHASGANTCEETA